jgi:1,4-alpha-glucan branching enzyme
MTSLESVETTEHAPCMENRIQGTYPIMFDSSSLATNGRISGTFDVALADVTFRVPADVGAEWVAVCGDFNDWATDMMLVRQQDGSFELTVPLCAGRRYQYRFLIDDERWENDRTADAYAPNAFGGSDSVVDLTEVDRLTDQSEISTRTMLQREDHATLPGVAVSRTATARSQS